MIIVSAEDTGEAVPRREGAFVVPRRDGALVGRVVGASDKRVG